MINTISQIGEVIQNSNVFNINHWNTEMDDVNALGKTIQKLFLILKQRHINYVLVGGIALLHYVEGRNTQDLDLLMSVGEIKKIPEFVITSQDMYFARAEYDQLQIDIFLTKNPLFKKVQQAYSSKQKTGDTEISIATVEGLILLKLYALPSLYRQGNFARVGLYENDIATLIQAYQPDLSAIRSELSKALDENDLRKVNGILEDIHHRIRRFGDRL